MLYIRHGTHILAQEHGGSQERHRRAGTEDVAGAVGIATAYDLVRDDLPATVTRVRRLRERLQRAVLAADGTELTGHPVERLPGILSIVARGTDGNAIVPALDLAGVAAAMGAACTTGSTEVSHVLTAMIERMPGRRSTGWPVRLCHPRQARRAGAARGAGGQGDRRWQVVTHQVEGGGDADGAGGGLGAGAAMPLLRPTVLLREDVGARRIHSAPIPCGPSALWAAGRDQVGAEGAQVGSTHGAACTASTWSEHAAMRARTTAATTSAIGWIVPTSLFASMTVTSVVRSVIARSTSAGSTRPYRSTRDLDDLEPELLRRWSSVWPTAWCSMGAVVTIRWPGALPAHAAPLRARLLASVPPLVNTISRASAPSRARQPLVGVVEGLARSRPKACTEEGLPNGRQEGQHRLEHLRAQGLGRRRMVEVQAGIGHGAIVVEGSHATLTRKLPVGVPTGHAWVTPAPSPAGGGAHGVAASVGGCDHDE